MLEQIVLSMTPQIVVVLTCIAGAIIVSLGIK